VHTFPMLLLLILLDDHLWLNPAELQANLIDQYNWVTKWGGAWMRSLRYTNHTLSLRSSDYN
jgi:hypothetical protein